MAPPQFDRLQLSSLLLSSQVEALQKTAQIKTQAIGQDAKMKSSPLDVGGERIIPSVTRVFTGEQTMYVFFQAYVPQKADASSLRAGLVFFRNGQRLSDTPMVAATEYDEKSRTASFRLSLPLAGLSGRPLHRASHRGRCGNGVCGVCAELFCAAPNGQTRRLRDDSSSSHELIFAPCGGMTPISRVPIFKVAFSGAGFSLRGLVFARTKTRRLKPAPRGTRSGIFNCKHGREWARHTAHATTCRHAASLEICTVADRKQQVGD